MANDPYWNNTVLLTPGDYDGDPNAAALTAGFSGKYTQPEIGTVAATVAPTTANGRPCVDLTAHTSAYYGVYGATTGVFDGDFTVEFWFYLNSNSLSYTVLFSSLAGATSNYNGACAYFNSAGVWSITVRGATVNPAPTFLPSTGVWHHFALVSSGGAQSIYIDGVRIGTGLIANRSNYTACNGGRLGYVNGLAANGINGYASDLRIYKGIAKYSGASFVVPAWPALPYASVLGTSPAATKPKAIIGNGSVVQPYRAAYKNGGGCMRFDGASYAETPVSTDFAFGTGDFTIEFWLNLSVALFAQNSYATALATDWVIGRGGQDYKGLYFNSSYTIANEYDIGANAWVHCAVTRQNGTLRTFRDGAVITTTANYSTSLTAAAALRFGHSASIGAGSHLQGLIDDLRITKGVARYTAAFTPPAQALPEGLTTVSGTVLDSAGLPCSRTVNVHSRATGRLLGTAVSNPVTGAYSIGAPEQCYVVVLDSTGAYNAKILDRVDPLT